MQAHPLSSRAATDLQTFASFSGDVSGGPPPWTSVAESSGLAHDAGNLLAALSLYCDLLSVPGVLKPEHRHYAEELHLLANRSSRLLNRLLGREEPCVVAEEWTRPVEC